jgi:manganese-dependent inorganic pyrophosphatase
MEDINQKIFIVGHTKPDLDAIASTIGYQVYKEGIGDLRYKAIRCDRVNSQTEWVFKEYNTELPSYVPDISGMNVVLVDHTFPENRAKGWENANIVEVIDHHDVKLQDIIPQKITIRPCGSTSTLVSEKIFKSNVYISKDIAFILLSAILDDTLGLKSPTTVQIDIDMTKKLNEICNISDLWEYSKLLFKKKDIWNQLSPRDIIEQDMRNVEFNGNWVSISQVETMNNRELKKKEIIEELEKINITNPFNLRLVMLTDVLKNDCILLVVGNDIPLLERGLNAKIVNNTVYLPNVVSRKKQILPILEKIYKED